MPSVVPSRQRNRNPRREQSAKTGEIQKTVRTSRDTNYLRRSISGFLTGSARHRLIGQRLIGYAAMDDLTLYLGSRSSQGLGKSSRSGSTTRCQSSVSDRMGFPKNGRELSGALGD